MLLTFILKNQVRHNFIVGINRNKNLNICSSSIEYNKDNLIFSKILFKKGIIISYNITHRIRKKKNQISLYFSFHDDKKSLLGLKKVTKPSRRRYITYNKLKNITIHSNTYMFLSTHKGILDTREALMYKIGGEILYIVQC